MEKQVRTRQLIPDRRAAVIALLLTGFLTVMTVRGLFWPHPLDTRTVFFMLPPKARVVVDAALYGYLFWLCIVFFRQTQGKERVLVAGYCPGILLAPIQNLMSPFAATSIQYIKALGIVLAFVAALLILVERSTVSR